MVEHRFGGKWTEEKLERIRKYLAAYTTIFDKNRGARFFQTTYVDAFAGTSYRQDTMRVAAEEQGLFERSELEDATPLKKGSVRIALETEPPFDHYLFLDSDETHVADLEVLKDEFSNRSIQVEQGEANEFLQSWCRSTDWNLQRAVAFLDPYGMQVSWPTLVAIAETRAIDMWLLFPLGQAVNRLLPKKEPPPEWARALTRTFGTEDWRQSFYRDSPQGELFDLGGGPVRDADFEEISTFFVDRLDSIFTRVANNPLPLRNSSNVPIYLLCFAAGNPKGAKTAVKIAQHILGGT